MKLILLCLIPLFHFGAADQGELKKIRMKVSEDAYPGSKNRISHPEKKPVGVQFQYVALNEGAASCSAGELQSDFPEGETVEFERDALGSACDGYIIRHPVQSVKMTIYFRGEEGTARFDWVEVEDNYGTKYRCNFRQRMNQETWVVESENCRI